MVILVEYYKIVIWLFVDIYKNFLSSYVLKFCWDMVVVVVLFFRLSSLVWVYSGVIVFFFFWVRYLSLGLLK